MRHLNQLKLTHTEEKLRNIPMEVFYDMFSVSASEENELSRDSNRKRKQT